MSFVRVNRAAVLSRIEHSVSALSPPVLLRVSVSSALQSLYALDTVDAEERAEQLTPILKKNIENKLIDAENDYFGYFYHVRIISASDDYVHGACHVFPADNKTLVDAKKNRARHAIISEYIGRLSPNEFEVFCGKLLDLIGVREPIVTPQGGDQGIDFFGRWDLQSAIKESAFPDGVERQFKAWIVGQAKRYDATTIGTQVVRELIGSVQLAKSKVFSSNIDKYSELGIAYCDPVFYCLIVTGAITSGVARLLKEVGVIFFDRDLIAVFLADLADGHFDPSNEESFKIWATG